LEITTRSGRYLYLVPPLSGGMVADPGGRRDLFPCAPLRASLGDEFGLMLFDAVQLGSCSGQLLEDRLGRLRRRCMT
jgi:hypothetical protein